MSGPEGTMITTKELGCTISMTGKGSRLISEAEVKAIREQKEDPSIKDSIFYQVIASSFLKAVTFYWSGKK